MPLEIITLPLELFALPDATGALPTGRTSVPARSCPMYTPSRHLSVGSWQWAAGRSLIARRRRAVTRSESLTSWPVRPGPVVRSRREGRRPFPRRSGLRRIAGRDPGAMLRDERRQGPAALRVARCPTATGQAAGAARLTPHERARPAFVRRQRRYLPIGPESACANHGTRPFMTRPTYRRFYTRGASLKGSAPHQPDLLRAASTESARRAYSSG